MHGTLALFKNIVHGIIATVAIQMISFRFVVLVLGYSSAVPSYCHVFQAAAILRDLFLAWSLEKRKTK
jgi:hypothetical protein